MNKLTYLLIALFVITCLPACDDDDPNTSVSVIDFGDEKKNEFDKYLEHIFVNPYNIEYIYKYVDIESDYNYELVPAKYDNAVKMANLIKYLCLDAYAEVAPDDFLKLYFPKMFMLIGSPAYNNAGTMVLGTAEGGLKITLYNMNNLDVSNVERLFEMYFHTIFHEFSHILHQTKDYTTDFDKICVTDYVGDSWNGAWNDKSSLEAGFISDYSSKEPNEDFVELISHYVTYTEDQWNAKMVQAGDVGSARLNQKMDIIRTYLQESWDIDIDALRTAIMERAAKLDEYDLDNIKIDQ